MESAATRLKRLRQERGLGSAAELARAAGIPEGTYRAYENCTRPLTPPAAQKLAAALGVPWQLLLFGKVGDGTPQTSEEASAALGMRVRRFDPPSAEAIREALAKPGKTQRGLAIAMGVDPAAISRLLAGKRQLKASEIDAAAGYLGLPGTEAVLPRGAKLVGTKDGMRVEFEGDTFALLPVYDARASAGPGAEGRDVVLHRIAFRDDWLRKVTRAPLDQLAVIEVDGDSMEPTLRPGDSVLVDFGQRRPTQRDGIYVLRTEGLLQVKRVSAHPASKTLSIMSDNERYPPYSDVRPDDVEVVGRVIWLGRQVGG
jgi:phage repressor protein C with HTH and peptisase S24 domain/DNA-binding XRE family transcriptional regulator